ncbi:tetratricopeptide repeat-containing sensor histidine kinase [Hymenobacter mucosus]|uniref:histidine kinase n=1 Tax=Hymenobacter mucosus TaxID=1411120 RepID=A0A238V6B7_9BACT|nr:ATP-binding protein [Hymenobacter mucosus]SNR29587.1 Histidine kinase-, DNA gyrase B-, and HSP90-like ATPase [Hymenobacter mucosus]
MSDGCVTFRMIRHALGRLLLVFGLFLGCYGPVRAQSPQSRQLRQALARASSDTTRVLLLADLSASYRYSRFDSVRYYARKGLSLARKIGYRKGEGRCLSRIGILLGERGNLPQALRVDLQALHLNEESHDVEGTARTLNQTGLLYYALEDYRPSLSYYFRAQRLYQEGGVRDTSQIISVLTNIGASYQGLGQFDSAAYFLQRAWHFTIHSRSVHQSCWGNPAPYVLREIGLLQASLQKPEVAATHYRLSYQRAIPENDLRSASRAYQYLAELYKSSHQTDSSIFYARKALRMGQALPFVAGIVRTSALLTEAYEAQQRPDSTLKYLRILRTAQDSLYNPQRIKQLDAIGFAEQQRLRQLENEQQEFVAQVRTATLIAGIGVLLLISILLGHSNRQQQRANTRLRTLNNQVTSQATELTAQRDSLARTLQELKITQGQLVLRERMASLGELMAGVAREIQQPVSHARKIAAVSMELCEEVRAELAKAQLAPYDHEVVDEMLRNLGQNQAKILQHTQRAESIVRGMLEYSQGDGSRQNTDLNRLAEEYLRFTYHDLRARHRHFHAALLPSLDPAVGRVELVRQNLGRALVGIFTAALQAVQHRRAEADEEYVPQVALTTKRTAVGVEIRVRDNGLGLSEEACASLFQRFPVGGHVGESSLGLSLSYDVITKGLGGTLSVQSREGEFTEFCITLPLPATTPKGLESTLLT